MTEPKDIIYKETIRLIKGVAVLLIISLLLCFLGGILDYTVVFGFLLGSVYSVVNFILIGFSVESALQHEDQHNIASYMTKQYMLRYLLTGLVILIGCTVNFINPFGVMVALFFPKAVIFFNSIIRKEAS